MLIYSRLLKSLALTWTVPTIFWRRDGAHCIRLQRLVSALGGRTLAKISPVASLCGPAKVRTTKARAAAKGQATNNCAQRRIIDNYMSGVMK